MIRRLLQLYREGGLEELIAGVKRFSRTKRRSILAKLLKLSRSPQKLLERYIYIRRRIQPNKYTQASIFKIINVDPEDINFRVRNVPTAWGRVAGGDWDRVLFEEVTVHGARFHDSNIMHFEQGVPWEDTPIFEARMASVGNNLRGFSSAQEVEEYFKSLDEIFESMKNNGYQCQTELMKQQKKKTVQRNNDEIAPTLNEIGVNIDRNGEIYWSRCGKHRLSLAKILDIDQIPVQVRTRHKEWEKFLRKIASGAPIPVEYDSHPDIVDMRPDSEERDEH